MMFVQIIQAFVVLHLNISFTRCTILHQPDSVILVDPGANVTLQCLFSEHYSMYDMFWYKQIKGQQPCAVAKAGAIADPYLNKGYTNTRFKIIRTKKRVSLNIININHWDEAVYYCGAEISFDSLIEFGNGVFLELNISSAALHPTEIDYLITIVIFQFNIIGICVMWIICLCIRIKQQKAFSVSSVPSQRHRKHIPLHMSDAKSVSENKETMSYTDRSAHTNQAKTYILRNPGQDVSGKISNFKHPVFDANQDEANKMRII